MKRHTWIIFICIAVCATLFGANAGAERAIKVKSIDDLSHRSGKLGAYKALIIGINDYKDPRIPDLETAINDATAMAKVLEEKYGFKVKLLLDRKATREAMYRALREISASTERTDSVLIYYAGHGDLDRQYDDGWWIPADAEGGNPVTYLDNVQVQKAMRSMKARHVLLISDSCYSGTLFGKARSLPPVIDDRYYLSLYSEKSRWGMTSGNKEPVSDAGTGGHSVFGYQLLKELEKNDKPFVTTQEIYTRIAPIISNNSEQTPLCRPIVNTGDQGGEFVFVAAQLGRPPTKKQQIQMTATVSQPSDAKLQQETIFWQSIQNSNDPGFFEAYLERFPNGTFLALAKLKLDELKKKQVAAITPPESREAGLEEERKLAEERQRLATEQAKLEAERKRIEDEKRKMLAKKTPKHASLDPGVKSRPAPQSAESSNEPIKVAIFPNHRVNYKYRTGKEIANRRDKEIGYYKKLMRKYNTNIEFEYSFLDRSPPTDQNYLFSHIYDENIAKNTWTKKGFFSEKEPNDLFVLEKGKELNVDLVFLLKKVWKPNCQYRTYIYDISSKKKYHFVAKHSGNNYSQAFKDSVSSVFKIYFEKN